MMGAWGKDYGMQLFLCQEIFEILIMSYRWVQQFESELNFNNNFINS